MNISRAKPSIQVGTEVNLNEDQRKQLPKIEEFINNRDYTGAVTLLEFERASGKQDDSIDQWIAYCAFHLGDYKRASDLYQKLLKRPGVPPSTLINYACCQFFLGLYKECDEICQKAGGRTGLVNRLQFHVSHKFGDEKRLMSHHQLLHDVIEDQLTLASMHYLRGHYQEAIDIYKRLLLENRELHALNVYVAMCYYKLDYFDVAQEVLQVYLQSHGESVTALNLRAATHYKLYNARAAESELRSLQELISPSFVFAQDLIRHNLVVFRNGDSALQTLVPLVDVIPEARLNLVIHYLRQDDIKEAYKLIKDVEPVSPAEYILKGIVNTVIGQEQASREYIKIAQQCFQIVGSSASECDTIPGRQCMASCFFLLRQFEDVLIYLNSIKSYFFSDDVFNLNYAQAKASVGQYHEAEECFLLVQSERLRRTYVFISWLARCYIMNQKPAKAWELYLKMETSADSYSLLQLIANDCYRMGQFFYAAKAFDILERIDPSPDYWEGKRSAICGTFQMVLAGRDDKERLRDLMPLLKSPPGGAGGQSAELEKIARVVRGWARDNGVAGL